LKHPIRYRLEAITAYIGIALFRMLPTDWTSALGGWLARFVGPMVPITRTAEKNLSYAFPGLTKAQRTRIIRDMWENLGRVVAEYALLPRFWRNNDLDRITVLGIERLQKVEQSGKTAILYTGHIGNWEIPALVTGLLTKPVAIVYRTPNNPLIEKLLRTARGEMTADFIPKGPEGARDLIRVLRNGSHVVMVVDQKMNTGLEIPFFGRNAMTGPAVVRLAMRFKCPLIPVRTERIKGCSFCVTFGEPWTIEETGDDDKDVTKALIRINTQLEDWIKERPDQWLWLHNRWPE